MTGVEMAAGFWAGAASAAGTGRRRPKGAVIKAAQFACAPEMFLRHEVEAIAPALTDRRLCQTAAYGGFANSEAALPDLGTKEHAQQRKRLCQHLAAALPRQPSWSYAFVQETSVAFASAGGWDCGGGISDLVCPSPGLLAWWPQPGS